MPTVASKMCEIHGSTLSVRVYLSGYNIHIRMYIYLYIYIYNYIYIYKIPMVNDGETGVETGVVSELQYK